MVCSGFTFFEFGFDCEFGCSFVSFLGCGFVLYFSLFYLLSVLLIDLFDCWFTCAAYYFALQGCWFAC